MTRLLGRSVATGLRGLLRGQLLVARWALLVVAAAAALTLTVLAVLAPPDYSIVGFARQGVIWFTFSMAIAIAVGQVNVHVGMGRTRRALGRAAVLAALAMSAVYAVGVVALIQVERGLYAAVGWEHVILDDLTFVSDTSQVGLLLGEYVIAAGAGQLCGLLCGITYYRFGALVGTLALPLTVGPVVLVQAGMSADVSFLTGDLAVGTAGGGAVRAAVVAVVLVVVAAAFQRILRGTPVRTAPLV